MQTVRDGKKVWPYCSECGCRLNKVAEGVLTHFQGTYIKDARGCICKEYRFIWYGEVKITNTNRM